MMPRRLLFLNAALVAVAGLCALYVARQLLTPTPLPLPARSAPPAAPAPPAPPAGSEPGAYAVVATRNLFSPSRSDTQLIAREGGPAVASPLKPILHGVVLRDESPIAYLEDPTAKRVAGYRIGDSIVGGTLQTIAADHVVINRPEGAVDVRLRDPSKPRPAAAPPTAAQPGAPSPLTGVIPPGTRPPLAQPPSVPTVQPAPSPAAPPPIQPGRRPFPLLRRVPAGVQGDAPQR